MWNYEKLLKKQLRQKLLDYMAKLKQEAERAVKAAWTIRIHWEIYQLNLKV